MARIRTRRLFLVPFVVAASWACGGGDATPPIDVDSSTDAPQSKDTSTPDTSVHDSSLSDSSQDSSSADSSQSDAPADAPDDVVLEASVDSGPDASVLGCTINQQCAKVEYCDKGGGNCGGSGTCLTRPKICPNIYKPVCGCDKKTYSNYCYAHSAGVSIDYNSTCE